MAKLVITSKPLVGLAHELGKQWLTIGRSPSNAFQILDSSVSGQHCEVSLRGEELLVRDMRSTNGTYINGKVITDGVLKMGDVLRLGEMELRLQESVPKVISPMDMTTGRNETPNPTAAPATSARTNSTVKQHHVLMVDDSMSFLETAAELFGLYATGQWTIHTACGADQALNLLQQHPIEIAVLDLNMPVLDGMQLLGMLHRRHPEVKMVVLTAVANDANRSHCLAQGAELFLEKPITPDGMRFVFNVLNDLITWNQREGFSGTLQQVSLTDIIQIECLRRNSCILEVHTALAKGEIYIESGAIVHAVSGEVSGEKALHRLLSLNNGQFHLYPYRQPLERTIRGSWECLLMESAHRYDEAKSAEPVAETVFIKRAEPVTQPLPPEISPTPLQPISPPQASPVHDPARLTKDNVDLPELLNGAVVVSTYDGQWSPVDSGK